MVKRLTDLGIALITLVLLSPFLLLVAIAIKLDSLGPVFYSQLRVGRRGRLFKVHKFRSMVAEAERVGPPLTESADPRVTRVGKVLRLLKLDELPQLFNVLKGDMSLVGPRPEIPSIVEQYIPEQREILEMKPGMTGPTQLSWINESEMYPTGVNASEYYSKQILPEKLRTDVEYVRTWSLRNDFRYLIRTPMAIISTILEGFHPSPTTQKGVRLTIDCLAVAVANIGVFMVRFDWAIPQREVWHLLYGLPLICVAYFLSFLVFQTYKSIWRYAGVEDLWRIIKASALGGSIQGLALLLLGWQGYPRSVLIATSLLTILLMGGMRFLERTRVKLHRPISSNTNHHKVVIIGAGETGESIAREIRGRSAEGYDLIGFVDDDPKKQGATIHGFPVLGSIESLPHLTSRHGIEEAIIAIPAASGNEMRRIAGTCIGAGLNFRSLPSLTQLMQGNGKLRYLREMNVDDLLRRELVSIDKIRIAEFLRGKRIMVTGAGGSVGSELCRQLVSFEIESLIMVERAENALHNISLEMRERGPKVDVTAALADIKHIPRMSEVFERTRPHIVFHTAAYKHVPILEDHPGEAVLNNIIGTKRLAEVARTFKVETFLFVSTDKAVRPRSLMGATKKICEMYITALSRSLRLSRDLGVKPRYFVVRFGNVLASDGSVVPLFQKQIEDGEPITITDPQATRYFMTISEAAGLILQSTCMSSDEDVFILNMGNPIKIDELVDDLVVASGLDPSRVTKQYVGLRPGDKLHEALWDDEERVLPSEHKKIFAVRQPYTPMADLEATMARLETLAMIGDVPSLLRQIHDIVPSYSPSYQEPPFGVSEAGEKYRILVIDDDDRLCEMLRETLERTYDVATAHSAAEGFDRIHSQIPHLILLDVKLPDQDGLQVCQAMRDHPQYRNIPIIMMTGYGDKDDVVTGLRAGADDYITKPFRLVELQARIAAILRRTAQQTSHDTKGLLKNNS